MENLTPQQVHFRNAFGGCYQMLADGQITDDDYLRLSKLALADERPSERLLRKCFPISTRQVGSLDDLNRVSTYWHNYHQGDDIETPELIVPIGHVYRRGGVMWVEAKDPTVPSGYEGAPIFQNLYGYDLGSATHMYVHGPIIVEFVRGRLF